MSVGLPPFQQLVDDHWRDVARLAASIAGPREGNDVAQEAWVRALAAYPTLAHARNLRSWLLTITARTAIDAQRATGRTAGRRADVDAAAPVAAPSAELPDEELWAGVAALPERQRLAVLLHYVGGLAHREVAVALATTPAASRRLVSDALASLRVALGDAFSPEVP